MMEQAMQALIQIQTGDRQLLAGIADVMAEGERHSGDGPWTGEDTSITAGAAPRPRRLSRHAR